MKILGIESSCDETAMSVVEFEGGKRTILASLISSQVATHAKYGGVIPEIAARMHIEKILPLLDLSLKESNNTLDDIDAIAVCAGPGLMSSLLIGVETAKTLAYTLNKPLIKVNHIEGHLLSCLSKPEVELSFPAIALIVSGGHTQLMLVKDFCKYKVVGATQDDAAGEAFDKAAKILDLGYPGGPAISKAAEGAQNNFNIKLPRPMMDSGNLNMSFSGLKTAVLYKWKDILGIIKNDDLNEAKKEMAAEFQKAVIDVLIGKTLIAAKQYKAKTIILGGGVSANRNLRIQLEEKIKENLPNTKYYYPEMVMTGDNAAMIAIAGYYHAVKNDFIDPFKLAADCNWEL